MTHKSVRLHTFISNFIQKKIRVFVLQKMDLIHEQRLYITRKWVRLNTFMSGSICIFFLSIFCSAENGPNPRAARTKGASWKGFSCSWRAHSTSLCVAVCCSVLQCVAVCCILLHCFALCCNMLQRVAGRSKLKSRLLLAKNSFSISLRCRVLQCVAACCSVLQRVALCCSVMSCAAGYCSDIQRVAACYSVLQRVSLISKLKRGVLLVKSSFSVSLCCSVLQCAAVCCTVCCNVLQCVAARYHSQRFLALTGSHSLSISLCFCISLSPFPPNPLSLFPPLSFTLPLSLSDSHARSHSVSLLQPLHIKRASAYFRVKHDLRPPTRQHTATRCNT